MGPPRLGTQLEARSCCPIGVVRFVYHRHDSLGYWLDPLCWHHPMPWRALLLLPLRRRRQRVPARSRRTLPYSGLRRAVRHPG